MKWKARLLVVVMLGLLAFAGLAASAAIGNEGSDLDAGAAPGPLEARFASLMAELVEEGVITQDQAGAIQDQTAPLLHRVEKARQTPKPLHPLLFILKGPDVVQRFTSDVRFAPEGLKAQLGECKPLAEIAEAQGVTLEELVGALTADAQARLSEAVAAGELTQAEASARLERLRDMVTRVVNHARGPALSCHDPGRPGLAMRDHIQRIMPRVAPHIKGMIQRAVDLLGLEPPEIVAQLRDGVSLAEVAEAQGVTLEQLVDALTAGAQARLSEAVAAGKLSEAEASERLERLRDMVTRVVTHAPPGAAHLFPSQ